MSDARVLIDGVVRAPDDAKISVYDRGFLYADSVFEVIRTYGGAPFGLEEHVARLHASAAKIALDLPWSERALVDEIAGAIRDAAFPESYVRVVVTRGVGPLGLDPDLAVSPTRVVLVHPLTLPPPRVYRDGVSLLVARAQRATDGTSAQGAKASNYLANLLALREAKRRGAYEPLFVDASEGGERALEGGTSNVFVVEKNRLVTPPVGRILAGITRRHVLGAAPSEGFTVAEEDVLLARLLAADEVFISSTVRELVPVVAIVVDDRTHRIGSGTVGDAVRRLHRAFRRHVHAPTSPMPWE